jgi:hypothetical protein
MRIPITFTLFRGPLIGLVLGLIFIGIGFLVRGGLSAATQDADLIASSYSLDAATWEAVAVNSTGVLQGVVIGDDLDANGFIISKTDRLVSRNKSSGNGGKQYFWQSYESHFSIASLAIDGGNLLITSQSESFRISGETEELIDTSTIFPGRALVYNYNGTRLAEGALRTSGVRAGDTISVLGSKTGNGSMIVTRLHVGDVASFEAAIRKEGQTASLVGYIMIGIGAIVVIVAGIATVRRFGRSEAA